MSPLDRRRFLAGSAALSTSFLLGACGANARPIRGAIVDDRVELGHLMRDGGRGSREGPPRRSKILIIGAGAAGLSAAWRLRREGIDDFEVFELAAAPGGTARGGELAGHPHPWGAHYLPLPLASQRSLCTFLEEVGIGSGIDAAGRLKAPTRSLVRAPQERIYRFGFWSEGLIPWTAADSEAKEQWQRFLDLARSYARPTADERRPFELPIARSAPDRGGLERIDAESWARDQGLTASKVRWALEYATRDDYGSFLGEVSAWALLHYFSARLSPKDQSGSEDLVWPEGNQHLISALSRGLEGRIHCGVAALSITPHDQGAEVLFLDGKTRTRWRHRAERVIVACPQFAVARLLSQDPAREARLSFRYSPWVVANLHLTRLPRTRGFEAAWDNVIYGSESLGYVDADHQSDRYEKDRVWTWYQPLCGPDERGARQDLLSTPWEGWRDRILADLAPAHYELLPLIERIDVWRWGHAMVKPYPGFLFGGARAAAAESFGSLHFAHADLGGLPLFEEAHWAGSRAAEEVLRASGRDFESLL